jgi:hypothetical protein
VIYTRRQIEDGEGFYTDRWTVIFQRDSEDAFVTGTKDATPGPGYHVAGGGYRGRFEWCDLR